MVVLLTLKRPTIWPHYPSWWRLLLLPCRSLPSHTQTWFLLFLEPVQGCCPPGPSSHSAPCPERHSPLAAVWLAISLSSLSSKLACQGDLPPAMSYRIPMPSLHSVRPSQLSLFFFMALAATWYHLWLLGHLFIVRTMNVVPFPGTYSSPSLSYQLLVTLQRSVYHFYWDPFPGLLYSVYSVIQGHSMYLSPSYLSQL